MGSHRHHYLNANEDFATLFTSKLIICLIKVKFYKMNKIKIAYKYKFHFTMTKDPFKWNVTYIMTSMHGYELPSQGGLV